MPISDYLKNDKNYLAHKDGKSKDGVLKNPETIEEHSSLALDYAKKIIEVQNLQPVLDKIGEKFFDKESENFKLWQEMFFDTIYLHDLGKANTDFQNIKMKNPKFKKSSQNRNSEHSIISANLYIARYIKFLYEHKEFEKFRFEFTTFIYINSFVISRHHGYLKSFKDYFDDKSELFNFYETYTPLLNEISFDFSFLEDIGYTKQDFGFIQSYIETLEESEKYRTIDLYVYAKLLYSLLVSADFYATSDYMSDFKAKAPEDFGVITDIDKFLKPFCDTEIYKSIQNYSKNRKQKDFKDISKKRDVFGIGRKPAQTS